MNLEELEGDAGDEGETERKVYAPGFRSELSSYGRTGASRRPMRLHEFQVSPFFPTEGGRRSMDMRYATLSGSPAPHPPPPPMWSSRRSSAATVADDDGERTAAAPPARRRSICRRGVATAAAAEGAERLWRQRRWWCVARGWRREKRRRRSDGEEGVMGWALGRRQISRV